MGSVRPAIRFSSVDLPQPEWPISVTNSPFATVRSISRSAWKRPFLVVNTISTFKFDPVPTADYYALTGFLRSSRPRQAAVAGLERKTSEKQSCVGYDFQFAGSAFDCVDGRVTSGSRIAGETGMAISNSFVIPNRFMHVQMAGGSELRLAVDEYRFPPARRRGDKAMKWVTVDLQMVQGRTAYVIKR